MSKKIPNFLNAWFCDIPGLELGGPFDSVESVAKYLSTAGGKFDIGRDNISIYKKVYWIDREKN